MKKPCTISLIITENCNLACVYCYEHNKTTKDMSFKMAKEILDKELNNAGDNAICLDFFGGEPFLNFKLIKQVVEYVELNYSNQDIVFFATTNGTLIHGEIQQWLREHKKFSCGLSLDGNPTAHNLNRSNSFEKIDLDFFKELYGNQPIKMTISTLSLPHLAESIKYISEKGFEFECNFAYGHDWSAEENKTILIEQLNKIIEFYLENPQYKKPRFMNFMIDVLSRDDEDNGTVQKYCGVGKYMRYYDKTGKCYPCQFFAPISAGDKAIERKDFPMSDTICKTELDKKCVSCWYQRICPMCMGANYVATGNMYEMSDEHCLLYRIVFAANAKLKALEWERGILQLTSDNEQALLRSILKIQQLSKDIM